MSDASSKALAPASERRVPGWFVALMALIATGFLYFFAQLAGGLLVMLYPLLQHWSSAKIDTWLSSSVAGQFAFSLIADGLLVIGVWLMLRWLRWRWQTIGLTKPRLEQIMIGLLAAAPYYGLYILVVAIISALIPSFNTSQQQQIGFENVHGLLPLCATFISLVILPPLAEEITMRGFLYTSLKRAMPWAAAGLLVSVLFGAAHLAEGGDTGPLWIGAIDTFTLSLVLVYLREKTGNLWAGITLHATKNLVAFAILFIFGGR